MTENNEKGLVKRVRTVEGEVLPADGTSLIDKINQLTEFPKDMMPCPYSWCKQKIRSTDRAFVQPTDKICLTCFFKVW